MNILGCSSKIPDCQGTKNLQELSTGHPSLMALKLDTYQIPSPWSYAGTRGPPFPTRMKAPKGRTEATVPSSTLCSSGMAPSSTSTVSSGGSGSAMTTQKGDVVATATAAVQVAGWFFFLFISGIPQVSATKYGKDTHLSWIGFRRTCSDKNSVTSWFNMIEGGLLPPWCRSCSSYVLRLLSGNIGTSVKPASFWLQHQDYVLFFNALMSYSTIVAVRLMVFLFISN